MREWPTPGLLVSKTAISSVARPGRGRSRSAPGSVDEREWEEELPRRTDRRKASGVGFVGLAVPERENAPELGRDSSVLSVILLRRARGSGTGADVVGREGKFGRETYDGEPV